LTPPRSPTIVIAESKMSSFLQNLDLGIASYLRRSICVLLALFMLYNPFAASLNSAGALNVRHPASNRATVGASELQHFSFANGRDSLSTHDSVVVKAFVSSSELPTQSFKDIPQVTSLPLQILGSSLWFRPPPAL
jgi:hypothetical protein